MIRKNEVIDAIAECQGERNPNANTCIKLAAYYIILDHLDQPETAKYEPLPVQYSYDAPKQEYQSDTEFFEAVSKLDQYDAMEIVDEIMTTLQVVNPRLYASAMRKIRER